MPTTIDDIEREAESLLAGAPAGQPLSYAARLLIRVGVCAAVTSLNADAMARSMDDALAGGVNGAEIQEVIALVSGLGVHSLMLGAPMLARRLAPAAGELPPLGEEQRALWDRYIGHDPYWTPFQEEFPGFLEALLRLSPDGFRAFHDYCAVPWRSGHVKALIKELAAMASDATPTHRFLPGMRLHLRNALKLGAGRLAIRETLAIAAAAPQHEGVP